jgi:hypothetical protein
LILEFFIGYLESFGLVLLQQPQTYVSLASLTLLEIVLGIDNIIFISILASGEDEFVDGPGNPGPTGANAAHFRTATARQGT